jgi:hypothetical protein
LSPLASIDKKESERIRKKRAAVMLSQLLLSALRAARRMFV